MKKLMLLSTTIAIASCDSFSSREPQLNAPSAPANLPPDNYYLNEFTDQRGCNYIRNSAGDGTSWIPLVDINGSQQCGGLPQNRFDVGAGISDPHGTIANQASPAPATSPEDTQIATNRAIGGFNLSGLFGFAPNEQEQTPAQITGDAVSTVTGTVVAGFTPTTPAPQPAAAPNPVPAPQPENLQPQTPLPEPQPIIEQPPAPVPAPAVTPLVQSSTEIEVIQLRDRSNLEGLAKRFISEGYSARIVHEGSIGSVIVRPKPGQTADQALSSLQAQGYSKARIL